MPTPCGLPHCGSNMASASEPSDLGWTQPVLSSVTAALSFKGKPQEEEEAETQAEEHTLWLCPRGPGARVVSDGMGPPRHPLSLSLSQAPERLPLFEGPSRFPDTSLCLPKHEGDNTLPLLYLFQVLDYEHMVPFNPPHKPSRDGDTPDEHPKFCATDRSNSVTDFSPEP